MTLLSEGRASFTATLLVGLGMVVFAGGTAAWAETPNPIGESEAGAPPDSTVRWTQIATSASASAYTCGVSRSGKVYCWGRSGNLGLANTGDGAVPHPVVVAGELEAQEIAVGSDASCALKEDGRLFCWGSNLDGEVGVGNEFSYPVPVPAAGNLRFQSVGIGVVHACGLSREGRAYCWGNNGAHQLGNGGIHIEPGKSTPTPQRVEIDPPLTQLSVGGGHTCALSEDGRAYCWGNNQSGQLGNETTDSPRFPIRAAPDRRFTQISAGGSHTCGLTREGALYCWGSNYNAQLGDPSLKTGAKARYPAPKKVASAGRFQQVQAGDRHTCARTSGGALYCWGTNQNGQLGDGTTQRRATPTAVAGDHRFQQVAPAGSHTCGLTRSGEARCWGGNIVGQLGLQAYDGRRTEPYTRPQPVGSPDVARNAANQSPTVSIVRPEVGRGTPDTTIQKGDSLSVQAVAGDYEKGLLDGDNLVWRSDKDGRVGTGARLTTTLSAGQIHALSVIARDDEGEQARARLHIKVATPQKNIQWSTLRAGAVHTCGVTTQQEVYCWGDNEQRQLGSAGTRSQTRPVKATEAQMVAPGGTHTCALSKDLGLLCWGDNAYYELGRETLLGGGGAVSDYGIRTVDSMTVQPENIRSLRSAGNHLCFRTSRMKVYCWGHNNRGQLATESPDARPTALPAAPDLRFQQVSLGGGVGCGVTDRQKVRCWGSNLNGVIPSNNSWYAKVTSPAVVGSQHTFEQVAVGGSHACGITTNGDIYCWGDGADGEMDEEDHRYPPPPQKVDADFRAQEIAAGGNFTCALNREGQAFCWGTNEQGQLGTGDSAGDLSETPVPVQGGHRFENLSVGGAHACGVTAQGDAYCWGDNDDGQLGDGSTADRSGPVKVSPPQGI